MDCIGCVAPPTLLTFFATVFVQSYYDIPGQPVAQPPLPPTSPPKTPPLPPSSSIPIPSPRTAAPTLHDALHGHEGSSEMGDPNQVFDDPEVGGVRPVRGGAPSAEASMLKRPEVRMHTVTL